MFSQLFEKPKMSEKLLLKPPFKYIFDIIMETSKRTGFAKDLFSSAELAPEFYTNKENKILFLKKAQDLVQTMLQREIPCKPTRVVAGHEPENTNLLLQAIYESAVSGIDSSSHCKKTVKKFQAEVAQATGQDGPEDAKQEEKPKEEPKKEEPKKEDKRPSKKEEKPKDDKS